MKPEDFKDILFDADYITGIVIVTLNHPKRHNCTTMVTALELWWAVDILQNDDRLHAMILTGARRAEGYDPKKEAFSSGGNFAPEIMAALTDELRAQIDEKDIAQKKLTLKFWECEKLVIVAINGFAVGLGITLPLACADLIYMSEHAWLQFPFVNIGILPEVSSTYILPRIVGFQKAKEIFYFGRRIFAKEALELRIVNEVVPHEQLLDAAKDAAKRLIPPQGPSLAVRMTKRALHRPLIDQISKALDMENEGLNRTINSDDFAEGVTARSQKRAPVFKGR